MDNNNLLEEIVIVFAGDSGDGIQFIGKNFSDSVANFGNDLSTMSDFPAEIRPPKGTIDGVSGFKLRFSNKEIYFPGDKVDVLVVMNAASLKKNIHQLNEKGTIIANTSGFDSRNLKLANEDPNILEKLKNSYNVIEIDLKKLVDEIVGDNPDVSVKEKDRSKNIFVLGLLYWIYDKKLEPTINIIKKKFPDNYDFNIKLLKAGYNYGDTSEIIERRIIKKQENLNRGNYRNILGNEAISLALISATKKMNKKLFYASYPITPASDILHFLANYESDDLKIFQAEDEISAICSSIGSSFSGSLGVTATSGPGMSLKSEGLGLAVMLELPLVVIDVQRAGPSTGMPTKLEQSDLNQAFFGRHGEAPLPIFACKSPSTSFDIVYKASKIAVEHMTPVVVLSDSFLVNSSEPWKIPDLEDLENIDIPCHIYSDTPTHEKRHIYSRNENLVRPWKIPSEKDFEHIIGGLEQDYETGNVSYDGKNHEKMIKIREEKINKIKDFIPLQEIELGDNKGDILVVSWGSVYGFAKTAVRELIDENINVSFLNLEYLNPLPKNLKDIFCDFKTVIVVELNNSQLLRILKSEYSINLVGINKIQGIPFMIEELKDKIKNVRNIENRI